MYKTLPLLSILLITASPLYAADQERAKQIVADRCHVCHGTEGEASNAVYPRLAGQNKEYIIKQLNSFRSGERKGMMNNIVADLKDEEIIALADYFSAKRTLRHRVRDKELAAVGKYIYHKGNKYSGVAACASCHGDRGQGNKDLPRLAGQHKRYLSDQLEAFIQRERTTDNAVMHNVAEQLTELERNAVALYASGLH